MKCVTEAAVLSLVLATFVGSVQGTGFCASNPCTIGTCMESPSGYYCTCQPGYSGAGCRTQIDYCKPNPCYNSATCKGFHIEGCGGYSCVCPPNFTGKLCEKEISPCSPDVNPCVNGICKSVGGEIRCTCPGGWTGQRCETKTRCFLGLCMNGGTCAEGMADHVWYCLCSANYTGDQCETAVNDCSSNPCLNGGKCCNENDARGYSCQCLAGFSGRRCENDLNPCIPCLNGGQCVEFNGVFKCVCAAGWFGVHCDQRIVTTSTSYSSSRLTSTSHVTTTTTPNLCSYSPCQNGGTCEAHGDSYHCICPMGWYGTYCTFGLCEFMPDLCKNGGACRLRAPDWAYCECLMGYTGDHCEVALSRPCTTTRTTTTSVSTPTSSTPTTQHQVTTTSVSTPSTTTPPRTTSISTTKTTRVTTSTPSAVTTAVTTVVRDRVVRVYVIRRELIWLWFTCGILAHSGLILQTESGKEYVLEYMDDGKALLYPANYKIKKGDHPDGATFIEMPDKDGKDHDWTKQNKGTAMPADIDVTPQEAQSQMQKIVGDNYNFLWNNCHAAQEALRLAWGLKVDRKRRRSVRSKGIDLRERRKQPLWMRRHQIARSL
ncbi:fibropellin-1 isoform X2 [Nematostella vectensis]|uniref:fibropellin-1 isoform X2 n=1 Tax=Nematostella vectensis TaxID=45351 RepID=UPI002076DC05|nr:fibropellin-1 isoform X2 [Nematostella vectensis]